MKHLVFTFLTFLFVTTYIKGQNSNFSHAKIIKEQAEKMAQTLLKKDYVNFQKYTYPKVIELMGGKEKAIKQIEKGINEFELQGITLSKFTIGEPSNVILIKNELQCTVPQTLEMKLPNGKLIAESTLIAISMDKGLNWYFLDTSTIDIQTLRKAFPNLSNELVIQPKGDPTFIND